jgi:putative transposase
MRTPSVPGEYYHVFNRGVEKRVVFSSDHDYQRFLILLFLLNNTAQVEIRNELRDNSLSEILVKERDPLVNIYSFALLPSHYHLLLSPVEEGGVAKFMQKLATGYTMYFNAKHERSGSLFQGKYKIKHAADENYLKYLFEYIHLNPIRERFDASAGLIAEELLAEVEQYPWSSLSVYSNQYKGQLSRTNLNSQLFEDLFGTYSKHKQSLLQWRDEDPPKKKT